MARKRGHRTEECEHTNKQTALAFSACLWNRFSLYSFHGMELPHNAHHLYRNIYTTNLGTHVGRTVFGTFIR